MRKVVLVLALLLLSAGCSQNPAPGSSPNPGTTQAAGPVACTVDRLNAANAAMNAQPFYTYVEAAAMGGDTTNTFIAPDRWETDSAVFTTIRIGADQWQRVNGGAWKHLTGGPTTIDPNDGPIHMTSTTDGQSDGTGNCLYTSSDGMVKTTIDSAGRPILMVTLGLQTTFDYSAQPTIEAPAS
jgi:hypothetical protein